MRYPVQRDPLAIVNAKNVLYEQMEEQPEEPDRNLTLGLALAYIDQNPRETMQRRIGWSRSRRAIRGSALFMSKSVIRGTSIVGLWDGGQVDLSLETKTHHNKRLLIPDSVMPQVRALGRLGFQEKPTSIATMLTFEHGTWSVDMAMDDGFSRTEMASMHVDDTAQMSERSSNDQVLAMAGRLLALPDTPSF